MASARQHSPCCTAVCVKILKRDFPVLILSLLILAVFFFFMKHAFRASIAIEEEIKMRGINSLQKLNSSIDEVFFGDELFEKDLQRHILFEPRDRGEQVHVNIALEDKIKLIENLIQPINSSVHLNYDESDEMKELNAELPLAQRLKKLLNCQDRPLQLEKLQYGGYWLLRNYIRGKVSSFVGCAETITLTTNGDYTFFKSLPFLIERWLAPVSFAIFAPGYDFNDTISSIQYVRNCLPESEHIQDYVTFHIYFPANHMPKSIPLNEDEVLLWPYKCDHPPPYKNVNHTVMYKTVHNMTYPINVGRNIARKAVNTYFILALDIELSPTPDLPRLFLEMVERNRSVYLEADTKRVYAMPIFEVTKESKVPENKTHLLDMLHRKKAIPFHSFICKNCHLVPKQNEWENVTDSEELTIFSSTKREGRFVIWEPFYISDNQEPMFDERVTWEGQSNKRIQGFAMCLLNYDYFILHPSFLVHTPGIKYFNKRANRLKYVPAMNRLIKNVIEKEYKIFYGTNKRCTT